METKNFDLKKGDAIVGNDGLGDRFGYYKETVNDKAGVWIRFTPTKNSNTGAVYLRSIDNIRLATSDEVKAYEA